MLIKTVSFQVPVTERAQLGSKPNNSFRSDDQVESPYVACHGDRCELGSSKVWGDIPRKNADGSAYLREKTEQVDLTPRSPWKYGIVGGLLGAFAGAGLGALGGGLFGAATGLSAGLGAVAVGGVVGGLAANSVRGEQVNLVWDTHEIKDPSMVGYHHYVGPGESNGERGFFHRYVPEIHNEVIGTYKTPRTERSKEGAQS